MKTRTVGPTCSACEARPATHAYRPHHWPPTATGDLLCEVCAAQFAGEENGEANYACQTLATAALHLYRYVGQDEIALRAVIDRVLQSVYSGEWADAGYVYDCTMPATPGVKLSIVPLELAVA